QDDGLLPERNVEPGRLVQNDGRGYCRLFVLVPHLSLERTRILPPVIAVLDLGLFSGCDKVGGPRRKSHQSHGTDRHRIRQTAAAVPGRQARGACMAAGRRSPLADSYWGRVEVRKMGKARPSLSFRSRYWPELRLASHCKAFCSPKMRSRSQ